MKNSLDGLNSRMEMAEGGKNEKHQLTNLRNLTDPKRIHTKRNTPLQVKLLKTKVKRKS